MTEKRDNIRKTFYLPREAVERLEEEYHKRRMQAGEPVTRSGLVTEALLAMAKESKHVE
ncbi:MAG: hypothetical protein GY832_22255 [Chloroflexi bacterium]|nr:hypothetical protein [Chloroflexota bacterium]